MPTEELSFIPSPLGSSLTGSDGPRQPEGQPERQDDDLRQQPGGRLLDGCEVAHGHGAVDGYILVKRAGRCVLRQIDPQFIVIDDVLLNGTKVKSQIKRVLLKNARHLHAVDAVVSLEAQP